MHIEWYLNTNFSIKMPIV